jgi:hypothetical protein
VVAAQRIEDVSFDQVQERQQPLGRVLGWMMGAARLTPRCIL